MTSWAQHGRARGAEEGGRAGQASELTDAAATNVCNKDDASW